MLEFQRFPMEIIFSLGSVRSKERLERCVSSSARDGAKRLTRRFLVSFVGVRKPKVQAHAVIRE